jgi:hypothetical protein
VSLPSTFPHIFERFCRASDCGQAEPSTVTLPVADDGAFVPIAELPSAPAPVGNSA